MLPARASRFPATSRQLFILLTSFALSLSIAVSAHAATYYVATNGSDSNPGTQAAPFKTIAHAVRQMVAGDTTYVRGGTYNEGLVWFSKSGTASAPIKLLNAPGESPVIDCIDRERNMVLVAAGSGAGSLLPIGWIHIEGFEIRDCAVGIRINNLHDAVFRRNWIHDIGSQGILGNGKNVLVDRNVINRVGHYDLCAAGLPARGNSTGSSCNKDHAIYATGTNWTITNNLIYDILACGVQAAGYPFANQKYYAADPSYSGASNWLIANNTIAYNHYCAGILLWQPGNVNNKIINNILYENGQKGSSTNGIAFTGSGGGHVIQNNLCYATGAGATACIGTSGQGKYTESNNIINTANPNFVKAGPTISGTPDFHLNAGSPAIDKGQNLSQVTWDHAGGKRPFGAAFDIGAYEFGSPPDSGSPPPNPTGGGSAISDPLGLGHCLKY